MNLATAQFALTKTFGFLRDTDIPQLVKLDRLQPLLVRCGACRFTCAAQDTPTLVSYVEAAGDYVRDVSFTSDVMDEARALCPNTSDADSGL